MISAIPIYFIEAFLGYIYPIYYTLEITLKSDERDELTRKQMYWLEYWLILAFLHETIFKLL